MGFLISGARHFSVIDQREREGLAMLRVAGWVLGETRVLMRNLPSGRGTISYDARSRRMLVEGDATAPEDRFILVRNFDEHLRRVAPRSR